MCRPQMRPEPVVRRRSSRPRTWPGSRRCCRSAGATATATRATSRWAPRTTAEPAGPAAGRGRCPRRAMRDSPGIFQAIGCPWAGLPVSNGPKFPRRRHPGLRPGGGSERGRGVRGLIRARALRIPRPVKTGDNAADRTTGRARISSGPFCHTRMSERARRLYQVSKMVSSNLMQSNKKFPARAPRLL